MDTRRTKTTKGATANKPVNGQWYCEPGRDDANIECECVSNPFGTMNRVLDVATAA
jgi:hypothetical protein